MTTPNVLLDEQWEIDGYVFGGFDSSRSEWVNVSGFSIGEPEQVTNDSNRPRADGELHGREYRTGRTIAFDLNALSDNRYAVLDTLSAFAAKWNNEDARFTPGKYSLLRYKLGGRTRRVWGSPRRFSGASEMDFLGNVPITADFRTVDPYFYNDVERTNTVTIVPPTSGGLVPPLSEPLTTLGVSEAPGVISVGGTERAWVYFIIYGPITTPRIRCLGEWDFTLNLTIPDGQFLAIDPRPWSRGIRLNNISAVGGALTQDSPRIEDLRLSPGFHEIILSGTDITGTASMLVAWRDAYTSY